VSVGRIPPATSQLPATRPQPAADVRAAQRAFFAAAIGQAQAQPQPQPARPATASATTGPEPERYLRPGSIIDIKV
jgi:hypothetical protein